MPVQKYTFSNIFKEYNNPLIIVNKAIHQIFEK